MGEKMECKPVCPRESMVGSGPHTWTFMSFNTKSQVCMLERLLSVYCSTHVCRHCSSFVPVIVSDKEYSKGTCLAPSFCLLWEKGRS